MKFFVARAKYSNGDRSHPWTLFASDMEAATSRLLAGFDKDEIIDLAIYQVDESKISFYRPDREDRDLVLEHPDIEWRRD